MFIKVVVKNVYGNDLVYPVAGTAQTFAELIGQKTFNQKHLRLIHALGFEIQVVAGQLPFSFE